jgi:hypothetical protein
MWWISKHDVFLFQKQNCWYWDEPWGESVIFKKICKHIKQQKGSFMCEKHQHSNTDINRRNISTNEI